MGFNHRARRGKTRHYFVTESYFRKTKQSRYQVDSIAITITPLETRHHHKKRCLPFLCTEKVSGNAAREITSDAQEASLFPFFLLLIASTYGKKKLISTPEIN